MKVWYDDIDSATLQRIKTYSAFNDATSKNLMIQQMYEYREKEIQDFKETNHELAETCIERKKRIDELEKRNGELAGQKASLERWLGEAKKLLQEYIRVNLLPPIERNFDDEVELFKQAEQFLKE